MEKEFKPIKLVIWDLDDTFWQGTLSEGPVKYITDNHQLVIELSKRGIVNSICSKNDHSTTIKVLKKQKIAEYFVFPSIDWIPKGRRIQDIIRLAGLRNENVLFIDDNKTNLEEAKFYSPGIQTTSIEMLSDLISEGALAGKDDQALTRLKQYKMIEKKSQDQAQSTMSNEEFLRQCQIKVSFHGDSLNHVERILELIERTNQLNYTKIRLKKEQLVEMLKDTRIETRYLRVTDRYGDYGICGFYAKQENRVIHFLFSCRILDMGIDRWLYRNLGCPNIQIIGDISGNLRQETNIDWINCRTVYTQSSKPLERDNIRTILVKGGCDLEQLSVFLRMGSRKINVLQEFNYVSIKGLPIHTEHTEIIKCCDKQTIDTYGEVIDKLKFLDRNAFISRIFTPNIDVVIYSILMDYTNGIYRYRDTDFVIPYGDFLLDITDPANWTSILNRVGSKELNKDFLSWFSENFSFLGSLRSEEIERNLMWIGDRLPKDTLFIVLNGAEVELKHPVEKERYKHHKLYNLAIDKLVRKRPNIVLCDVRRFVTSKHDVIDNIRHYRRIKYFELAGEIDRLIKTNLNNRWHINLTNWKYHIQRIKWLFCAQSKSSYTK